MKPDPDAPILRIAILANGRITVDGAPATVEAACASLRRLAERRGVVWYYREAGETKGTPESALIIQAVVQNRLPIRLSSRPDYSDSIGLDGKPIQSRPPAKAN